MEANTPFEGDPEEREAIQAIDGEAATHLLQASKEIETTIDGAEYSEWLYHQHKLREANQSSLDEDFPWIED